MGRPVAFRAADILGYPEESPGLALGTEEALQGFNLNLPLLMVSTRRL